MNSLHNSNANTTPPDFHSSLLITIHSASKRNQISAHLETTFSRNRVYTEMNKKNIQAETRLHAFLLFHSEQARFKILNGRWRIENKLSLLPSRFSQKYKSLKSYLFSTSTTKDVASLNVCFKWRAKTKTTIYFWYALKINS